MIETVEAQRGGRTPGECTSLKRFGRQRANRPSRLSAGRELDPHLADQKPSQVALSRKTIVGRGGLEPPRVSPLAPKASASASSAIRP